MLSNLFDDTCLQQSCQLQEVMKIFNFSCTKQQNRTATSGTTVGNFNFWNFSQHRVVGRDIDCGMVNSSWTLFDSCEEFPLNGTRFPKAKLVETSEILLSCYRQKPLGAVQKPLEVKGFLKKNRPKSKLKTTLQIYSYFLEKLSLREVQEVLLLTKVLI